MRRTTRLILTLCLILVGAGCSGRQAGTPEPTETDGSAVKVAGIDQADEPVAEPTPASMPFPAPVAEPGVLIEVAATKEGLTRIGDTKCKMCHKIQHASWTESSHAGLDPVLDCESCHGPGSEYKKMSIMKNREQASAAGMVMPEAGSLPALERMLEPWNERLG
jgi:hypothetical protein